MATLKSPLFGNTVGPLEEPYYITLRIVLSNEPYLSAEPFKGPFKEPLSPTRTSSQNQDRCAVYILRVQGFRIQGSGLCPGVLYGPKSLNLVLAAKAYISHWNPKHDLQTPQPDT